MWAQKAKRIGILGAHEAPQVFSLRTSGCGSRARGFSSIDHALEPVLKSPLSFYRSVGGMQTGDWCKEERPEVESADCRSTGDYADGRGRI
jgi:hypothetical protein